MSDEEIRELERLAASGDCAAAAELCRRLERAGMERDWRVHAMRERQRVEDGNYPIFPEPDAEQWRQVGGDVSAEAHGGLIARLDHEADQVELLRIDNVVELTGNDGYDVGRPFWYDEYSIPVEFLTLGNPETLQAIRHYSEALGDPDLLDAFTNSGLVGRATMIYEDSRERTSPHVYFEGSRSGWSNEALPSPPDEIRWWGYDPANATEEQRDWQREEWIDQDEQYAIELRERGLPLTDYPWEPPEPEDDECSFCEAPAIGWDETGELACGEHGGWA